MAEKIRLSLYVSDDLSAWLDERAKRAMVPEQGGSRARTELELWRAHLAVELRSTAWTLGEIGCIADVLNGTVIDDAIGHSVVLELSDAFASAPGAWAKKWNIDEAALVEKVRRLSVTGVSALTDAVSRWWGERHDHDDEGWRKVGVRIAPTSTG